MFHYAKHKPGKLLACICKCVSCNFLQCCASGTHKYGCSIEAFRQSICPCTLLPFSVLFFAENEDEDKGKYCFTRFKTKCCTGCILPSSSQKSHKHVQIYLFACNDADVAIPAICNWPHCTKTVRPTIWNLFGDCWLIIFTLKREGQNVAQSKRRVLSYSTCDVHLS